MGIIMGLLGRGVRLRPASWLLGSCGLDLSAHLSLEPGVAGLLDAELLTCSCMGRAEARSKKNIVMFYSGETTC